MNLINPFTDYEIQEMFEKQLKKEPFEIRKTTKDENGKEYQLRIHGAFIPEFVRDIWNDDYIIHFDLDTKTSGQGYAENRFTTASDLKNEIFEAFHLEQPLQYAIEF